MAGVDFRQAVAWLQQHLAANLPTSGDHAINALGTQSTAAENPGGLRLPVPNDRQFGRVRQYLTQSRGLAVSLIERLVQSGKLYAGSRANAVFLLVAGKAQRPVARNCVVPGRGPGAGWHPAPARTWDTSGSVTPGSREIVLCESAIDAMSCFQIHPQRICISTSGVRADPPWLDGLLARGYDIFCGFDADGPGDAAAARMMALHPAVRRLRPPAHDWNDALPAAR